MIALRLRPLADRAVTIDLADAAGTEAAACVAAAQAAIAAAVAAGHLPGVRDVAGAFASVTVHYDCLETSQERLIAALEDVIAPLQPQAAATGRLWSLPCAYGAAHGPDLPDVAAALGLEPATIIDRHSATTFTVLALGFLPGLPFLGDLPPELARPRRSEPRTRVPAGSVAIANRLCVIYPWDSPGGWHLIGRCPVQLFDIRRNPPALLAVGDRLRFHPVTEAELAAITGDLARGARGGPEAFLTT